MATAAAVEAAAEVVKFLWLTLATAEAAAAETAPFTVAPPPAEGTEAPEISMLLQQDKE